LREAVEIASATDDLALQGGALLRLAEIYAAAGRADDARAAAERAVAVFERKGHRIGASARARRLFTSPRT
jgi:hypothetical protein